MAKYRIMIVEDEAIVAADIQASLEKVGYSICAAASSGMEAITKADLTRPDLVLMDIMLKGNMDGIAAASQIKELYKIPVVYLTAFGEDAMVQRAKVAEPYGYITKPFKDRDLFLAIEISIYKKQAEARIEKMERWLATVLKSIGDAVIASDKESRITFMNAVAERLTGWNQEDALGKKLTEVLSIKDQDLRNLEKHLVENVITEGMILNLIEDRLLIAKDGTEIPISDSVAPIKDDNDETPGSVLIFRDITERKQAERDKEKLERQLRQAQKLEAIGTLAGGIAHDFNNILGIILGYVELVRSGFPEESRDKRNLDEALKACRRGKELVQQILVFSRMEIRTGREPVNAGTLIKETLGFLRASLPTTIEMRQDLSDNGPLVSANATQIQQVVTNLCTNAAHAMEEAGGILEVSLTEVDFDSGAVLPHEDFKPGPWVKLTVKDTGPGMDAWTLERVFDPYFTTKEVGKGTGLGLSVVRGIVTKHEGTIAVRSEPGKGTTFDVYLPRIEGQATTEVEAERPLPKGTERILFVDDEAALADIGRMGLEFLGYAVVAKTDSVEALEIFRAQPEQFDLVITDYTMPRMTGLELAKEIMRVRPDIPVIVCTGYNERTSEEESKKVGVCAFVVKPVSVVGLGETIREVLKTREF
jgi:two-component system, cell cycle sensor histidine kinase and response regulator CckA